jgi:hypothetical protein
MPLPYFTQETPAHWLLEIAKGNLDNHSLVHVYGKNVDVDLAAAEDLIDQGGTYTAPTVARVHNIVSDDANDDGSPVGTGARTVTITGLDSSYVEQSETITMNGVTDVPTINSYIFIYDMIVTTVGSNGSNVGTITATAVTDATVSCQISVGNNRSYLGVYQVPANKTAYLMNFHSAILSSAAAVVSSSLRIDPNTAVFAIDHVLGLGTAAIPADIYKYFPFKQVAQKSIIKMQASTSANNTDMFGRFGLLLVG